ncbi:MAG: hypothetical protein K0Q72_3159 [Armatimonadetes bacterium]|nr:hypothetical protein [Armatimonadota bacterium]
MTKARRLLIGSTLALGVTLPLALAALLLWDERPQRKLPDGSVVRLSAVRYSPVKPVVRGPAWKRRLFPLAPHLPPDLARRIAWETYDPGVMTPPSALTLALEHDGVSDPRQPFGRLRDRHGCRYGSMDNTGGSLNFGFYPFFPRREPSFHYDAFLGGGEPKPVPGGFTVGNPVGTQHPTWSAATLPATQRSGPLAVTVTEVTRGWSYGDVGRLTRGSVEVPMVRFRFRVPESSRDWTPVGAKLTDATGGSYRFGTDGWSLQSGMLYVRGDNVCREEPAYDYRLEFSRAPAVGAPPDQTFDLGAWEVSALAPKSLTLPDGRPVHVFAMDEDGGQTDLAGNWQPRDGEIGRLWTGGRVPPAKRDPPLPLPGGSPHAQQLGIPLPKGQKRVHLYFGIYRSRFVTFRVKPQWLPVAPRR